MTDTLRRRLFGRNGSIGPRQIMSRKSDHIAGPSMVTKTWLNRTSVRAGDQLRING